MGRRGRRGAGGRCRGWAAYRREGAATAAGMGMAGGAADGRHGQDGQPCSRPPAATPTSPHLVPAAVRAAAPPHPPLSPAILSPCDARATPPHATHLAAAGRGAIEGCILQPQRRVSPIRPIPPPSVTHSSHPQALTPHQPPSVHTNYLPPLPSPSTPTDAVTRAVCTPCLNRWVGCPPP